MAAVTLVKRVVGRGHDRQIVEGTDDAVLSSLIRTSSGVVTLYGDTFTSGVTLGGGATATGTGAAMAAVGGDPDTAATAGGATSQTGGVGKTTGAGGASSTVGGVGGLGVNATSDGGPGGAANLTGGTGGLGHTARVGGVGGSIGVQAGTGGAANGGTAGDGGSLTLDAGSGDTNGTITIGGTNSLGIGIGRTGQLVTIPGSLTITQNLTVSGTTTTVSTTNLVVADSLIFANNGGGAGSDCGIAWDQGGTADPTILFEGTAGRFQIGTADTSGGTATPASLSVFLDLEVKDVYSNSGILGTLAVSTGTTAVSFQSGAAASSGNTGAITVISGAAGGGNSGALDLDVGTASGTVGVITLGTTNALSLTMGNTSGAASVTVDCGTGGASFGASANVHLTTLGGTNSTSTTTVQSGSGAMTFTAGGAFDVNAAGAITIDSSAGTITIGGDDIDQAIGIGTAGERITTIGNNVGANGIALETGTGGLGVDANGDSTWTMFDWTITLDEVQTAGGVGAGNPYGLTVGAGAVSDAAAAGGTGGSVSITAGVGGVGHANPQDAGAGGTVTVTAGVGGAAGANAGSNAGDGGDVALVPGAAGATGSGIAGDPGRCLFTSGGTSYPLTATGTGPSLATSAQDIIGAINEVNAAASEPGQVVTRAVDTATQTVGRAVYISSAADSTHTDAQSETASEIIGFVKTVGVVDTGEVVLAGLVDVAMASGLNVSAGDVLFLGAVGIDTALAGQITNTVSNFTAGDTVYEVGVANEANGNTSSDSLIEMVIRLGSRIVV